MVLRRGVANTAVVATGMGPARARKALGVLRRHPARALAVAGLSGALDDDLRPGDIAVASSLSFWSESGPSRTTSLASASQLVDILEEMGFQSVAVPLLSLDHLVRRKERRHLRKSGARIVDMESAWLADASEGRPLAVLRVIVDSPAAELASLSLLRYGVRALRILRATAPALERWAARVVPRNGDPGEESASPSTPGANIPQPP
jgi:4-hydroxy-3-methylbut-2-enyl diphosphate reductase